MTGTFMLLLWAAGVVTALVVVVGVLAFRDFSMRETVDILLRTATVVVLAVLGWTWLDYSVLHEQSAERRALDARSSELTAQAIQPGSALACLNSVGNEVVEAACAQALFSSPQVIAAAVAYVDARIALLADSIAYANRDLSYTGELEHLRGTLEADRFGFVAHVLAGRGCTAAECAAFKLFKDTSRVQVNLKERAFDAHVTIYAANWPVNKPSSEAAAPPPPAATLPPQASGPPVASRFSFPSSASIPPVSIMSAEPTGLTVPGNSGVSAEPPTAERPAPPARRQSANRPPQGSAKPLPPPPRAPSATGSSQTPSPNPQ